jgi:glycosyltransferase involved in cell wall biosynthesis
MKIYGICLIKNESDIIEYCLQEAAKWADKIIVYDNGSTDGTWEIVNELSLSNKKIIPWKQDSKPYHDGLRGEAFNAFKQELTEYDWWAIIDADEFFTVNPRDFLLKVPKIYHLVKTISYEYLVTVEDYQEYEFKNHFPEDLPLIKYYKPQTYSENRFMRHRSSIIWNPTERMKWPKYSGVVYQKHIPLKHYQYRSPTHIQKRIEVRQKATQDGYAYFKRDLKNDWKEILKQRNEVIFESDEMTYETFKDVNVIPKHKEILHIILHFLGIWP